MSVADPNSPPMSEICGWGRHPVVRAEQREAEDLEAASRGAALSRGLGRSYGDASLPARGAALCTRRADRILAFDPDSGVLRAEAGLSLHALNQIFPARGWASPVSPGTQYVTLGGMVASDVHGKNHHVAGCFGESVRALRMRVGDGRVLEIDEALRAGSVPRDARRHGTDRPHPRGRGPARADSELLDLRPQRALRRPRGAARHPARRELAFAVRGRLGRHHGARIRTRARDRHERPLCRGARGARGAAAAARAFRRALRPARLVRRRVEHPGVQPALLPRLPRERGPRT